MSARCIVLGSEVRGVQLWKGGGSFGRLKGGWLLLGDDRIGWGDAGGGLVTA